MDQPLIVKCAHWFDRLSRRLPFPLDNGSIALSAAFGTPTSTNDDESSPDDEQVDRRIRGPRARLQHGIRQNDSHECGRNSGEEGRFQFAVFDFESRHDLFA